MSADEPRLLVLLRVLSLAPAQFDDVAPPASPPASPERPADARAHPVSLPSRALPPPPPLPEGCQYHVFLTHDWGEADELGRNNHATVARVNAGLKERGLVTWFDSDRMVREFNTC